MTVSYEQAREIVREELEPRWAHGTFCIDDREIVENDEFYVFNVGAREDLIDGNDEYIVVGGGTTVVYKASGRLGSVSSLTIVNDPTIRSRANPYPTLET